LDSDRWRNIAVTLKIHRERGDNIKYLYRRMLGAGTQMKIVSLGIQPIAKVVAAIYALFGVSFWIAYCFGKAPYLGAQLLQIVPKPQSSSFFNGSLRGWATSSMATVSGRIRLFRRNRRLDRDGLVCISGIAE
jgi:hypothetical protein